MKHYEFEINLLLDGELCEDEKKNCLITLPNALNAGKLFPNMPS